MASNIHTVLVMATRIEASPFIKGLSLKMEEKKPFPLYRAGSMALVISGIGKVNCAVATAHVAEKYDPSILVNLGAAGAVKRSLPIGTIFHIKKIIEYDRPNLKGLRHTPVTPARMKGYPTAILATADRPAIKRKHRDALNRDADLVDMEGAAFSRACSSLNRKGYLFKIVTDSYSTRSASIIKNIIKYRADLYEFFREKVLPRLES
jgi:nucleoside phosphorylase